MTVKKTLEAAVRARNGTSQTKRSRLEMLVLRGPKPGGRRGSPAAYVGAWGTVGTLDAAMKRMARTRPGFAVCAGVLGTARDIVAHGPPRWATVGPVLASRGTAGWSLRRLPLCDQLPSHCQRSPARPPPPQTSFILWLYTTFAGRSQNRDMQRKVKFPACCARHPYQLGCGTILSRGAVWRIRPPSFGRGVHRFGSACTTGISPSPHTQTHTRARVRTYTPAHRRRGLLTSPLL